MNKNIILKYFSSISKYYLDTTTIKVVNKRGRPRKNSIVVEESIKETKEIAKNTLIETVKNKRGRPRKNSIVVVEEGLTENNEIAKNTIIEKGRPRKNNNSNVIDKSVKDTVKVTNSLSLDKSAKDTVKVIPKEVNSLSSDILHSKQLSLDILHFKPVTIYEPVIETYKFHKPIELINEMKVDLKENFNELDSKKPLPIITTAADISKNINNISNIVKSNSLVTVDKHYEHNFKGSEVNIRFIREEDTITLSKPSNLQSTLVFINFIRIFLEEIEMVKERGYINKNKIPKLDNFIKDMNLNVVRTETKFILVDEFSKDFYTWVYNYILIEFYSFSMCVFKNIKEYNREVDYEADLLNLTREIYSKLHPLIKLKLEKAGISVIINTVAGYDSEYELNNAEKNLNDILSIQLALNTRNIIRIPKVMEFKLGTVHALTSEIFLKEYNSELKESYVVLEESIRKCINNIRTRDYKYYEEYMNEIVSKLDNLNLQKVELLEKQCLYYILPKSEDVKMIKYSDEKGISFLEIVKNIEALSNPFIERDTVKVFELLKYPLETNQLLRIKNKSSTRFNKNISGNPLTISVNKRVFVCCHLTNADLSILTDFEQLKFDLDLVHKNFVTLSKPLQISYSNVYIRDTSLLAPAGKRSLASIGDIYGEEYKKIILPGKYRGEMKLLLKEDKDLFENYALRDSEITLKHANEMELFNFNLKKIGVPITLSSMGKQYVLEKWRNYNYTYQISPDYLLGNTQKILTPTGLNKIKETGMFLAQFIANYKGGRNESFMYGYEKKTTWFDYDLTSAYTTSMAYLGHPDYSKIRIFTDRNEILGLTDEKLLTNYIILKVKFEFPRELKYPSIPCYIDKSTTVYPLSGESMLTGIEYLLAKTQKCKMEIDYGICIPFKEEIKRNNGDDKIDEIDTIKMNSIEKVIENNYEKPYFSIIKELQIERCKYPKKSLKNLLYKEISNSIYGNVLRGISNKKLLDIKTGDMKVLDANELSNPILGCYITALIRTVIGETLDNINYLNGQIVSVTTDGFITDIENLEEKLMELPYERIKMLILYRKIRSKLGFEEIGYEEKNKGKGIISWCTRGQLGIESYIKATTGFQTQGYEKDFLAETFINTLDSNFKYFDFIQKSLRGGNEIFKKGGHVTMVYKERRYSLSFDNKRRIIDDNMEERVGEKLLDSKPLICIKEGQKFRGIKELFKIGYSKRVASNLSKTYKSGLDAAIRTFIKGLKSKEPLFGLEPELLKNYDDIIKFIKGFEKAKNYRISRSSISHLKKRITIIKCVEKQRDVIEFVNYIKTKFINFREEEFYK